MSYPNLALGLVYIYIYIYHHHVVRLARISLTLSRHFSLSFIASGRSSELHPVTSHSCCMYVRAGRPAFARPYVGVHRSTSLGAYLRPSVSCRFITTIIRQRKDIYAKDIYAKVRASFSDASTTFIGVNYYIFEVEFETWGKTNTWHSKLVRITTCTVIFG